MFVPVRMLTLLSKVQHCDCLQAGGEATICSSCCQGDAAGQGPHQVQGQPLPVSLLCWLLPSSSCMSASACQLLHCSSCIAAPALQLLYLSSCISAPARQPMYELLRDSFCMSTSAWQLLHVSSFLTYLPLLQRLCLTFISSVNPLSSFQQASPFTPPWQCL